jgi:DNA polymerase III subunit epsilon
MNFVAIDFETATNFRSSACAVGIVTVEEGIVTERFYSLIEPPENIYYQRNIAVHGITAEMTENAPSFPDVYPEIKKRMKNKTIVAHNESFDRSVLKKTMEYFALDYSELNLAEKWECTLRMCRKEKIQPANLQACANRFRIPLNHHEALSDALACAKLFVILSKNSQNSQ